MRRWLVVLLVLATAGCQSRASAPFGDLASARDAAHRRHRPLLVLVRDEDDDQAIDLGHRLLADADAHRLPQDALVVLLWRQDPAAEAFPAPAKAALLSGLTCLQPDAAPAATAPSGAITLAPIPRSEAAYAPSLAAIIAGATPAVPAGVDPPLALAKAYIRCRDADGDASPAQRAELARQIDLQLGTPTTADLVLFLDYVVYLLNDASVRQRFQAALAALPPTHDVLAAEVDLADQALSGGDTARANGLYDQVIAHRAQATVLAQGAAAMRQLAAAARTPARRAWEARTTWDGVVLVRDRASFCAAIACWTPTSSFPVLLDEDHFAPRFIAAFHPAQVVRLQVPPHAIGLTELRAALLLSWSAPGAPPTAAGLSRRLRQLQLTPSGVVLVSTAAADDSCLAGLALAAARFQGLDELGAPSAADGRTLGPADILSYAQAMSWAGQVDAQLERWLPSGPAWRLLTLCAPYPYRWRGNLEAFDQINCLDDLLGRDAERTRSAVVGRLIDATPGESVYQAMCALFLQPTTSLAYDTYQQNPFSEFGDAAWAPFAPGQPGQLPGTWLVHQPLSALQDALGTWNHAGAVYLGTAGGPDWWFATAAKGTCEEMPGGDPCIVQVEHSYSAADPWNVETLAGRCLWGGAYVYTGSVAEPFVQAFQSPRYLAPRQAQGIPLALSMRTHAGEFKAKPWRLLYVGDPQVAMRRTPLARTPGPPPLPAALLTAIDGGTTPGAALRLASRRGELAAMPALLTALIQARPLTLPDARLGLSCALQLGDAPTARALWLGAAGAAAGDPELRRLARSGLMALLSQARRKEDLAAYERTWCELVTTRPQADSARRLLDEGTALSAQVHQEAAWLALVGGAGVLPEPYAAMVAQLLARQRLEALLRSAAWQDADAVQAHDLLRLCADGGADAATLLDLLDRVVVRIHASGHGSAQASGDAEAWLQRLRAGTAPAPLTAALDQLASRRPYFRDWQLLGPLPEAEQALSHAIETQPWVAHGLPAPAPAAAPAWIRPYTASDFGFLDLNRLFGVQTHVHAYARCVLVAPRATSGQILLGSDDGATVWLDGVVVHQIAAARSLVPDQDAIPVRLAVGTHQLLVRIDQLGGDWGFCLRLTSAVDTHTPLPVTLRNALAPAVEEPAP